MKCPVCNGAQLAHEVRDLSYTYKGSTTALPGIEGDFCPACGEGVLGPEAIDRFGQLAQAFRKQVNAALVDPAFIRRARKTLNLDQREAGEIFGGGVNAFSRYETGKAEPPLALVKLLGLLVRHPELLEEVRTAGSGDGYALAA